MNFENIKKMKTFQFGVTLLWLLFVVSENVFSQSLVITDNKPGKLSKKIKSSTLVNNLQITGVVNSDDMKFLSLLPNLEVLDLSNTKFEEYDGSAKQYKNQYIQKGILNLSGFGELKKLILPSEYNEYFFRGIVVTEGALPNTAYLELPAKCTFVSDSHQMIYFQKIKITGATKKYWDNKESNKLSILVDTLIVPTINDIACTANQELLPFKIFTQKENRKILNRWDDSFDISLLTQVDSLGLGVFWKSKLEKITIPANIKSIPPQCFYECKNLKEVDLGKVTNISSFAFAKTNIEKIVIPASVTDLEDYAFNFSNIKQIEFLGLYPPALYHINEFGKRDYNSHEYYGKLDLSFMNNCDIIIPEGSRSDFSIGRWEKLALKEKGEKSEYNITVEKAGTLAALLDENIINTATSLTIKGFLYDTDFEAIKKCAHLRLLDLSHTFITLSPKTLQDSNAERQFLANYLAFVADVAKQQSKDQYNNGQKNLAKHIGEQLEAMTLKDLASSLATEQITPDARCQLPSSAFSGMNNLKELKLPLQLTFLPSIGGCKFLETVMLPPALKSIGNYAFSSCSSLKNIEIPATVEFLGTNAFSKCLSLEKVDLSNTSIEYVQDYTFEGCKSLLELHFPKTIKKIENSAMPRSHQLKSNLLKLYFKTRQAPPYFVIDSNVELHIPKGSRAGWQAHNYAKSIIEE